jgi:hypothetical protein
LIFQFLLCDSDIMLSLKLDHPGLSFGVRRLFWDTRHRLWIWNGNSTSLPKSSHYSLSRRRWPRFWQWSIPHGHAAMDGAGLRHGNCSSLTSVVYWTTPRNTSFSMMTKAVRTGTMETSFMMSKRITIMVRVRFSMVEHT